MSRPPGKRLRPSASNTNTILMYITKAVEVPTESTVIGSTSDTACDNELSILPSSVECAQGADIITSSIAPEQTCDSDVQEQCDLSNTYQSGPHQPVLPSYKKRSLVRNFVHSVVSGMHDIHLLNILHIVTQFIVLPVGTFHPSQEMLM